MFTSFSITQSAPSSHEILLIFPVAQFLAGSGAGEELKKNESKKLCELCALSV
jgi:hypothetical protein